MQKKILSFILTIAMIFGVLPLGLTVSAAEPEPLNPYTLGEIDLNAAPEGGISASVTKRTSDLAGKDGLKVTIKYDDLTTSQETSSAAINVSWTFTPFNEVQPDSEPAKPGIPYKSEAITNGNASAESSWTIAKDDEGSVMPGTYALTITTVTADRKPGPTAKYRMEVLPADAVARVRSCNYDEFSTVVRDEYYDSFAEAFKAAANDCDNYGTTLTMLANLSDFTGFGNDVSAADWLTIDANGFSIGSADAGYLPVSGWVEFENLSGKPFLKLTGEYPAIVIKSVVEGKFTGLVIDCDGKPENYLGSIIYNYAMENPKLVDAASISVNASGYTAVSTDYGICLRRTTDYPYALLGKDGTFDFFSSIRAAEEALAVYPDDYYETIYVMNYINVTDTNLSRKDYYYPGEIDDATAAKLKTFIRVTDGRISDFYVYEGSSWTKKYSNYTSSSSISCDAGMFANAKIHELTGTGSTPGADGVDIDNAWTEIDSDGTITDGGAYKISTASAITIDMSSYAGDAAYRKFTLFGDDAGTALIIKGNGSNNVDFNLIGEFDSVTADNATVYIGADDGYKGNTVIGALTGRSNSNIMAYNGLDLESYSSFATDNELKFGYVDIESGSFDTYGISIGGELAADSKTCALEVGEGATVFLDNCRIALTTAGSVELTGVRNKGMIDFYDTDITVSNTNTKIGAVGIYNDGGVAYLNSNNRIAVTNGSGIVSVGEGTFLHIYELNCELNGSAGYGILAESGVLHITPDDLYGDSIDKPLVSVNAAAGTAVKTGKDAKWSLQGETGRLRLTGANALVAEGITPHNAPEGSLITTGIFEGDVSIKMNGETLTGKAALEALIPKTNYTVGEDYKSYRIVNHEQEFRTFLESDINKTQGGVYTLPCSISINGFEASFYGPSADFGMITVGAGKHIIDFNGHNICSAPVDDTAVIDIPDDAILQIYNKGKEDSSIRSSNTASLIEVSGGEFVNGGTSLKAVNICDEFGENASIIQITGKAELYGGTYSSPVIDTGGELRIYGGEFRQGVMEVSIYAMLSMMPDDGEAFPCMYIYGGKFYGARDDSESGNPEWLTAIASEDLALALLGRGTVRTLQAEDKDDTAGVIPYGYTVQPCRDGSRIDASNMTIDKNDEGFEAKVKSGGYLLVSEVSTGGSSSGSSVKDEPAGANIEASAAVSGSTATVNDIPASAISKAGSDAVVLDLSGMSKPVDEVRLPAQTAKTIADSASAGLEIKLSTGTVSFDAAAMDAICEAAEGKDITLNLETIDKKELSADQKSTVEGLGNAVIVKATLSSGGKTISGFGVGSATVTIAYEQKNANNTVAVYYLDENGRLTRMASAYDAEAKTITFTAPHFSEYVITELDSLPFTDVAESDYYADAVRWAYLNNVTNGTDAEHFSPDAPVTRAQVVTFLWRAAGCPEAEQTAAMFKDVDPEAYYIQAVEWAVSEGITNGTSETAFSPDALCTRAQIVTFLARFADVEDADTESVFSDVSSTDYFAAAVKWAKDNGVTDGTSATTFSPDQDCTRAQAVTFLWRWMVR